MLKKRIIEKRHRLPRELYRGIIIVVFSLCVNKKAQLFSKEDIFSSIVNILLSSLASSDCDAHVYIFMPDHCHLMLGGRSEDSDLWKCVVDFKQRSGYWLSKNGYPRWQKDFYDHIIRKEEDIGKQIKYILENPVRKGIVDDWKKYPFKGSTVYSFDEWEY